ncbi:transposase, partial [Saccharopolyspora sp. 7B]
GFDAGKKINGRKRHIAIDTVGLLICVLVTSADAQDRTTARNLLVRLRYLCPSIRHLRADSGYTGTLINWATSPFGISIEIVDTRRPSRVRRSPPTMGRRTQPCLDQPTPPLRPRLRTTTPTPRSHRPPGHDPHHQQTPHLRTGTGTDETRQAIMSGSTQARATTLPAGAYRSP